MKAQWIWPVRRTRRKDTSKRTASTRARIDLHDVASGLVKPRHSNDVITDGQPFKALYRARDYFKPCVRWVPLQILVWGPLHEL